jgi:hypothetical protein
MLHKNSLISPSCLASPCKPLVVNLLIQSARYQQKSCLTNCLPKLSIRKIPASDRDAIENARSVKFDYKSFPQHDGVGRRLELERLKECNVWSPMRKINHSRYRATGMVARWESGDSEMMLRNLRMKQSKEPGF